WPTRCCCTCCSPAVGWWAASGRARRAAWAGAPSRPRPGWTAHRWRSTRRHWVGWVLEQAPTAGRADRAMDASWKRLAVTITLESPLALGARQPEGQSDGGLDYVPGARLRGAVAEVLLGEGA